MRRLQTALMVAMVAGFCATTLPALALGDFERGNELYSRGDFQAAADAYIDAICANRRYYPAHYQLGNTYMKLGKFADAQSEYEMCLEMYPDAKTRSNCQKALRYLTGTASGKAAVRDRDHDNNAVLDSKLAAEGQRRASLDSAAMGQKRAVIEKAGANLADRIKENAKAQIEQMRINSPAYGVDIEKNDRVGWVSPDVVQAVNERADAQAQKAIEHAKKQAGAVSSSDPTSVTDGLRSQIYPSGNSNIRLSPRNTNVYVRNYEPVNKKVADMSNGVK